MNKERVVKNFVDAVEEFADAIEFGVTAYNEMEEDDFAYWDDMMNYYIEDMYKAVKKSLTYCDKEVVLEIVNAYLDFKANYDFFKSTFKF